MNLHFGLYLQEKVRMQFLIFIIAYPFLWMISILPFRVSICYRMRYTFSLLCCRLSQKNRQSKYSSSASSSEPKERLSIEKNHTAIYVICLWK
jgi:KDO2-lipid IV(A) lauroyltransferase